MSSDTERCNAKCADGTPCEYPPLATGRCVHHTDWSAFSNDESEQEKQPHGTADRPVWERESVFTKGDS